MPARAVSTQGGVTVQVYISKNDQQWGPFDLNQLERLKEEGALKATDWAWE